MRNAILALLCVVCLAGAAQAATYHQPDKQFIETMESYGIPLAAWDSPEYAAVSFPHAYRLTRYYRISHGQLGAADPVLMPEQWKETGTLDLRKLRGLDGDGELDLMTLLRDRLMNHSMVVLQGDKLVHQHFFDGMSPDATHLDMSVTKSFTSLLASIAVAEGKLDMSKKVEGYLPEFKGTAFEGTTIQDVADMRCGLDIPVPEHKSWDPRLTQSQEWNGPNNSGLHGIKEYLVLIKKRKYPIGEVYQYQDPQTELLGLLVEKVTGVRLADYMENRIWKRIGAENDCFWMSDPTGFVVASGGLNMATRDLARVGRMLLNDGRNYLGEQVISPKFIEALWQGNDAVRSAWKKGGKEVKLAPDGWYKDQFRVLNVAGHKVLAMVGIHGQALVMEKESGVVIAMNGGYPQTETPRMANLLFYQTVPAILDALSK